MSEYIVYCIRKESYPGQRNDAYPEWKVVTAIEYRNNAEMPEFLGFHITQQQYDQVLNGLVNNDLYVDAENLSKTILDGWVMEAENGEIKDLREIPNAYDYIIEIPRPEEVAE